MATVPDKSGNSPPPDLATHIPAIPEEDYVSEYLLNGASNDLGINGSTPATFKYTVPKGKKLIGGRLLIYMEAATAMDSLEFGNLTALTNGVSVIADNTEITNWKDNVDILTDMFDLTAAGQAFGKTTITLAGRWTFYKAVGGESGLDITDSFSVVIQDNIAAIVVFRIKIQGTLENTRSTS